MNEKEIPDDRYADPRKFLKTTTLILFLEFSSIIVVILLFFNTRSTWLKFFAVCYVLFCIFMYCYAKAKHRLKIQSYQIYAIRNILINDIYNTYYNILKIKNKAYISPEEKNIMNSMVNHFNDMTAFIDDFDAIHYKYVQAAQKNRFDKFYSEDKQKEHTENPKEEEKEKEDVGE